MKTNRLLVPVLATLALGLAACSKNPADDKPKAQVAEAVEVSSAAATAPAAGTYEFSSQGSKLSFVGAKVTGKHDGAFEKFSGKIQLADGKLETAQVSVEVDVASVTSDNPKLTGHLKSPDFFDVQKFPTARFTSTAIRPGAEGGATHTITGNLELHGVKKSITFPATVRATGDTIDVGAEFALNRKDFGIVYPGMPDDLIKDDVLMKLAIVGKKPTQAAAAQP